MKLGKLMILASVTFLAISCKTPSTPPMPQGPVAYVAHGALFDRENNQIEVTAEFTDRAQTFYRNHLLDRASVDERARFLAVQARFVTERAIDERQRLYIDALLLDLLIRAVQPSDSARLLTISRRLSRVARLSNVPDELRRRLEDAGLATSSTSQALTSSATGQAYRTLCEQNGVPIPPDWGTAGWVSRGELKSEFISGSFEAEVFTFQSLSPEGVCLALPRWDGNRAELLGIICLGKVSAKACFWDNQTGNPNNPQFFPLRGEVVPFTNFGGGADLIDSVGGVCTTCHAGENPFVIHPNTPLGLPVLQGLPLFADRWHEPIVKPGWPENPGPNQSPLSTPGGACDACHTIGGSGGRLPQLSNRLGAYCNDILGNAMRKTMPPGNAGSLFNDPHVVALRDQCAAPPPPDGDLARFVRITQLPATVNAGATFTADVTFSNAGTARWTGAHSMAVAVPSAGGPTLWSTVQFPLGATAAPVFPTEEPTRTFSLRAPAQAGTYNLSFVLKDGVGRVLAAAPQAQIVVTTPGAAFDNASVTIVNAPGSLPNGQSILVTVTVTNTGTTTWGTPGYALRLNRTNRISLPQNAVALQGAMAPGDSVTLTFLITCNGLGTGGFSAQMGAQAGAFGQSAGRNVACQP